MSAKRPICLGMHTRCFVTHSVFSERSLPPLFGKQEQLHSALSTLQHTTKRTLQFFVSFPGGSGLGRVAPLLVLIPVSGRGCCTSISPAEKTNEHRCSSFRFPPPFPMFRPRIQSALVPLNSQRLHRGHRRRHVSRSLRDPSMTSLDYVACGVLLRQLRSSRYESTRL